MIVEDKQKRYTLSDKTLFKRIFKYMKPHWWRYLVSIILMGVSVGLEILSPFLTHLALKELGKESISLSNHILFFILGIGSAILANLVSFFQNLFMHKTGQYIVYEIRREVFSHIQKFSHHQLNEIPVGTLVTRCTADINVLFTLYTSVLINILRYIATLIGVYVAMLILNPRLALIVLAIFPSVVALTVFFRIKLRKIHRDVRTEVSNMNAFLSENISGMKVTQIFNQEDKKYKEFEAANNRLKKASIKEIFTFGVFRPLIYVIYFVTVIVILYTGTNEAITLGFIGAITYDELYAFYQYISRFFNPIQNLADQYNNLQSAFAAAEKIYTILDIKPEILDSEDAIDIELEGTIEFRNVWFAYIEDEWILKNVSFTIHPKDVVAFVGATGAGKSTILGLITRNYDIQKGQILIDGIDIKKIKLSSLRSQIGQMLQDVFLFSGTIADNIRLNEETITDEDIKRACDEVNASHFIDKEELGIYAPVGERGNNLSLGQRQLISFARVLVHKPKFIILDEATSNIDTETELLIQDSLEKVIKNNTMIMVAHRLSTIQHATKIFVFDHGQIIEEGNHQELLKQRGRYYQLYMLQFERAKKYEDSSI